MTTLITGGASRVGIALAKKLSSTSHPILFGTRSTPVPSSLGPSVKLNWGDPSTFSNPFDNDSNIAAVYLLGQPFTIRTDEALIPFIDLAVSKGVKTFVYMASAADDRVQDHLRSVKAEYTILRPTWFIENLVGFFSASIKDNSTIQTVVRDGKIPFVSVEDIAQVAYDAIVNPSTLKTKEPWIIGPELASYADVAGYLSTLLGRTITHTHISAHDQLSRYLSFGLTESYAQLLIENEEGVDKGSEEKRVGHPDAVVGKIGVREWLEKHKDEVIARLS